MATISPMDKCCVLYGARVGEEQLLGEEPERMDRMATYVHCMVRNENSPITLRRK